jgi:hypothetical protein
MNPTIKFGTFLGVLLLAATLSLHFFSISTFVSQIFFLFIPALLVYTAIRDFLRQGPPRPAYNYKRGAVLGLSIVAVGSILFALVYTVFSLFAGSQEITLSSFFSQLLHVLPNGVVVALLVPLIFFGKNEQTASLDREILDDGF